MLRLRLRWQSTRPLGRRPAALAPRRGHRPLPRHANARSQATRGLSDTPLTSLRNQLTGCLLAGRLVPSFAGTGTLKVATRTLGVKSVTDLHGEPIQRPRDYQVAVLDRTERQFSDAVELVNQSYAYRSDDSFGFPMKIPDDIEMMVFAERV